MRQSFPGNETTIDVHTSVPGETNAQWVDRIWKGRSPDQLSYVLNKIAGAIKDNQERQGQLVQKLTALMADRHRWIERREALLAHVFALGGYGQTME